MEWVKRAWRGEEKLWKVFWIYGVVFGIALHLLSIGLKGASAIMAPGPVLVIIGSLLYYVYEVWVLVAQWRCAFNTGLAFWGYIVRVLVALAVVLEILALGSIVLVYLLGATGLPQYGFHMAQCTKKMREYAVQQGVDPNHYVAQNNAYLTQCTKYLDDTDKDPMGHMVESTNPKSPYYMGNTSTPDKKPH